MEKMKKQEEEFIYGKSEVAEFILENISDKLNEKLSRRDILLLLQLEEKYWDELELKNNKTEPFISFDLKAIDQDDINDYVLRNALKHNLILNLEEVDEIMYSELYFLEINGQTENLYEPN